ncbi:Phophatidylserine decarboxylase-domain-containing protein [Durotheca rogersii]|uniref:Phophatidylserine decarboxylase-domain-containing protein n=1 Tax=Durotheca rogersii TaxID=419775 RepID=UPI00221EAD3D|nr:Phophatidylserine decarboxylase-domain-containing protein [Durotheca rogersii]KAI5865269.1 Phophatidylserine decarboxylase-domain-containing protein [Durotheca rogersii]
MVHQRGDDHDIPQEHRLYRHGAWLPADYRIQHEWLKKQIDFVDNNPKKELIPVLQEFKHFIEGSPRIYMYFNQMWEEIPHKKPYDMDPTGSKRQVRGYRHMLAVLNHIMMQAPHWTEAGFGVGMVGVPMMGVFDYAMATPSGHAAFLDPGVNKMLKKILNEWGKFLKSPRSADVLGPQKQGWFSKTAVTDLMEVANAPLKTSHKFEDMYICDPTAEHYGFRSWDDFFTRQLREGVRPVAAPEDDSVVVNACESAVYNLARHARLRDRFWIKHEPYSVLDMLGHDPLAAQFDGATVYQGFLSALSYHRWHAPVSGRIVRAFVRDGTYFSEPLFQGPADPSKYGRGAAPDPDPDPASQPRHKAGQDDGSEEGGGGGGGEIDKRSIAVAQGYLTALATRAVIFMQADNAAIGLLAFVGVGMDEVSTCELTVAQGQHVAKGDQIGMFHFGGSSHCLLFRADVPVDGFPPRGRRENVPVRGQLAVVRK